MLYLHSLGVFPSIETEKTRWKLVMYNIYSIIVFVIGISSTSLLTAKIIQVSNDIDAVAELLFLDFCFINQALTGFYYLPNRMVFRKVLLSLDTILFPEMGKFASESLQNQYVGKAVRFANKLLAGATILLSSIFIPWIFIPVISAVVRLASGQVDRNDESLNSIMYVMWVPQNFTEAPKLELVIAFKSCALLAGVLSFGVTVTAVLTITVYLTSYFRLLCQSIEDIESLFPDKIIKIYKATNRSESDSSLENQILSTTSDMLQSLRVSGTVELFDTNHEERYAYLKKCTAFHQKLLE